MPLCTRVSESIDGIDTIRLVPFAALVVSKGISGRFQGETIYRLSWAYRCARLVCRPDSDWLTPLFTTDDKNNDIKIKRKYKHGTSYQNNSTTYERLGAYI